MLNTVARRSVFELANHFPHVHRDDTHIEPPSTISEHRNQPDNSPSPIYYIPHPLGKALSLEIFASFLELLSIAALHEGGPTDPLEPELYSKRRRSEESICPE